VLNSKSPIHVHRFGKLQPQLCDLKAEISKFV
jgi:hypothetical protein